MEKCQDINKVNQEKSVFMGVHITSFLKDHIGLIDKAQWKDKKVKYLGICVSKNIKDYVQLIIFSH